MVVVRMHGFEIEQDLYFPILSRIKALRRRAHHCNQRTEGQQGHRRDDLVMRRNDDHLSAIEKDPLNVVLNDSLEEHFGVNRNNNVQAHDVFCQSDRNMETKPSEAR